MLGKLEKVDLKTTFQNSPSQNFLAENFTLPPREGDETACFAKKPYPRSEMEGDCTANFAREILLIEQLKRVMTPLLDLSFLNPHDSKNLTTVKTF